MQKKLDLQNDYLNVFGIENIIFQKIYFQRVFFKQIYKTVKKKVIIFKAAFYACKNRATLIDIITYVTLEQNDV